MNLFFFQIFIIDLTKEKKKVTNNKSESTSKKLDTTTKENSKILEKSL